VALPSADELSAAGLAWARVMPTLVVVPAFGLRALPAPARGVLGLALAAGIYPALLPIVSASRGQPWYLAALEQIVIGLPIALACAIPLWAATMAGGVVDVLRGSGDGVGLATVEGKPSGFGVLLATFASAVFLSTGGPARAAAALGAADLPAHPLVRAAQDLTGGIALAVAIAGPVLAAAVVLEVAFALVARAASPAQIHGLLSPLRAIGLLAIAALVLERVARVVADAVRAPL